jgi:hypothetical protein
MWTLEDNKFKAPESLKPKPEHVVPETVLEIEVKP